MKRYKNTTAILPIPAFPCVLVWTVELILIGVTVPDKDILNAYALPQLTILTSLEYGVGDVRNPPLGLWNQ